MHLATVITADVVGSRQQDAAMALLPERLKALQHPLLVHGFAMSRGDEIQGLADGLLAAPQLIRKLRYASRPLTLRVGVGLGAVPSPQGALTSWDLSGEAFFRARQALDALKKTNRPVPNTSVVSWDGGLDAIADALFALLDAVCARWTQAQWEATIAYETAGTYEAAAKALGIAFQNVEKRCRAARWSAVRAGEAGLHKLGGLYLKYSPAQA